MISYIHTTNQTNKGGELMQQTHRITIKYKKQPQKYLLKVDSKTYKKLKKALDGLELWEGDIVQLTNSSYYRLKIPQYRFIFTYDGTIEIITMNEINTRTNINYKRYTK